MTGGRLILAAAAGAVLLETSIAAQVTPYAWLAVPVLAALVAAARSLGRRSGDRYTRRMIRPLAAVHPPEGGAVMARRRGYYRPTGGRRLRRYVWRRLVPWPIRWLFGWR